MKPKDGKIELPVDPVARKKIWEQVERSKCERKKKYLDEHSALVLCGHYNEDNVRTRRSSHKSRAYLCPWCTYWHLTTVPKR